MDNRFENNGKDQNVGQGDGAIGKQVNITQKVTGNNNIVTGTGDIHLPPPPVVPRQLPYLDACFLGRDKELAKLIEQLHPGKVVAVCGPGGMGKTALAAQAVHKLEEDRFLDGIVFHSFYHQPSTDMALQTICQAFQIKAQAGLVTAVQAALAGKKALLILDGAEEADDLKAVLDLRSTCGVLITSRKNEDALDELLELRRLPEDAAEEVFRRYSKVEGDETNVQDICKILDGWPVALRIAGRYLRSNKESAREYLEWLEKEPFKELGSGKHQEENAALLLRRSVAQVIEDARLALGLAGTLAFAPLAREPVMVLLDGDKRRARTALNELVTYGLLEKREEGWLVSHALIHAYARSTLSLSTENLEQLAWYYITCCDELSKAGLKGYARLDKERAHCLRLMESCLASQLWVEVQFLEEAIKNYLDRQGYWREQLAALEIRMIAVRQSDDHKNEGPCLARLGYTWEKVKNYEKALTYYTKSLPILRKLGNRQGEGATLHNIASIYNDQGKYNQALQLYEQSLKIRKEIGDRQGEGMSLNSIGMLYWHQGNNRTALQYVKQGLPILQDIGDKNGEGVILDNIGSIYYSQNLAANSIEYRKQSLAIFRETGDLFGEAMTCFNTGLSYEKLDDLAQAEKYIAQAMQLAETIDHPSLEEFRDRLEQVRGRRAGEAVNKATIGIIMFRGFGDLVQSEKLISQAVKIAEDISHPELEEWRKALKEVRAALRGK